jgi:PAS domain S-box-containing protein
MDTAVQEKKIFVAWRPAVILVLTVVTILLTVYCLLNNIQTVFTHFYYVPIILASYWFQKKGVLYSAGMGVIYLACVIVFTGYNPQYIVSAAARVIVFIIIAAVVMVLSMRITTQQSEIEQSEKKYRTIWEHIQAGIVLIDRDSHVIIAVNPEGERMTGYTEKEMIGHSCHKFICPAETGKCPISDLGMTFERSERVLLNRNGESVPVLKTVTATTIGDRNILIENYVIIPASKNT